MNLLQKLRQVHTELAGGATGLKAVDNWALAGRLLPRLPVDAGEAARVVEQEDIAGFDALLSALEAPRETKAAEAPTFPQPELDHAYKAFRKRLKVQRLADESRLGGRYTSGGRTSGIDAIIPPDDFPPGIWNALEQEGRLKHTGGGFYADARATD